MIINIRGTNGSGKSTIIHGLLGSSSKQREIHGLLGAKMPEAHRLEIPGVQAPVFILGPYQSQIGGCDRIRPYDTILTLLDKYSPLGHVVFEGVLVSDNYGRVGEWLESKGKEAAAVFLDTSLEECLGSIANRTEDARTKHVERKFQEIKKVRGWFLENGKIQVVDVSRETGLEQVLKLLKGGHV